MAFLHNKGIGREFLRLKSASFIALTNKLINFTDLSSCVNSPRERDRCKRNSRNELGMIGKHHFNPMS
jgi:hypothetical protein